MVDAGFHERRAERIHQVNGWWWPVADVHARPAIIGDADRDIAAFLALIPGRNLIMQAGACVGVYPIILADHFRRVVTVEPDADNYACLEENLAARDSLGRVAFQRAGLGERAGTCEMVEMPHNCGAHRVEYGGSIPVVAIDDLNLPACDAIWLDIEGAESLALRGAEQTIRKFSPVISIEDKGLQVAFGVAEGEAQRWLAGLGYEQVAEIGRDKVFRRSPSALSGEDE